jgi:hypothetical protein
MLRFLLLFFTLTCTLSAFTQQYIYISEEGLRKVLRADIGYTQWSMQPVDSAARIARGIHLLNEVKILSAGVWLEDKAFTLHDAFYMSLDLGALASEQHTIGTGDTQEKEGRFSTSINMGYLLMAGYRVQKWGALAGIDFRWRSATVGDLTMPNLDGPLLYGSRPVVLRAEYGMSKADPAFRVMLTAWSTLGSSEDRPGYQAARLEFPLSREGRTWFCATWARQEALSEDVFRFTDPQETVFSQWMIGLRIGNLP